MRRQRAVYTLLSLLSEAWDAVFEQVVRNRLQRDSLYPGIAGMLMSSLGEIPVRSGA
jgi:hypothetical protein